MDKQMEGQTDRQTLFHRTLPVTTRVSIILNKHGPFSTFSQLYIAFEKNGSTDFKSNIKKKQTISHD